MRPREERVDVVPDVPARVCIKAGDSPEPGDGHRPIEAPQESRVLIARIRTCATHMRAIVLAALALLAACGSQTANASQNVTIGTVSPWPAAVAVRQNDRPRILAAELSSDVIRVGGWWSGRVATTTNVAVVELRSPSFSFILSRPSYGQFVFHTHVLAVPSLYRRGFDATIVARGAGLGLTDART